MKLVHDHELFANSQLSQKKHKARGTSRGCSIGPALEEDVDCSHDIPHRYLCNLFLKASSHHHSLSVQPVLVHHCYP